MLFKVTFELDGTGVYFNPAEPIHLDALLAWALEALMGEFDCATLVGYMETVPVPAEPFKSGFQKLDDLPKFVEWFKRKRDE